MIKDYQVQPHHPHKSKMKAHQADSGPLSQDQPLGDQGFILLPLILRFTWEDLSTGVKLEMYGSLRGVLSIAVRRVDRLYQASWDFYQVSLDKPHTKLLYFKWDHDNKEQLISHVQGPPHAYSPKIKQLLIANEVWKGNEAFGICLIL